MRGHPKTDTSILTVQCCRWFPGISLPGVWNLLLAFSPNVDPVPARWRHGTDAGSSCARSAICEWRAAIARRESRWHAWYVTPDTKIRPRYGPLLALAP